MALQQIKHIVVKLVIFLRELILTILTALFAHNRTEIITDPMPEPIIIPENDGPPDTVRTKILAHAKNLLGKDASSTNLAPDETACAEAVSNIIQKVFPDFPIYTSTAYLHLALLKDKRFKATLDPKPGNIIISPTGRGNGSILGHCGVFDDNGRILSNNSATGLLEANYTIESWVRRYRRIGGFPIYYHEAV